MRVDHHRFRPSWLLRNTHLMTLALALPRRRSSRRGEQVVDVVVGEGARVRCHFRPSGSGKGTVVVLHGLTGSADAPYVHGMARKAAAAGFGVIRFNARGCGGLVQLAPNLSHVGLSSDIGAVLRAFTARGDAQGFHLFGFSMGGNLALKAAAELAVDPGIVIRSVVAISPAIDVERCARDIDEIPRVRFYRDVFVRELRRALWRLSRTHDLRIDRAALAGVRTLREFDELYTVPTWGFADVQDYWRRSSAIPLLDRIEAPVLAIAARDDPLVPLPSLDPLRRSNRARFRFLTAAAGGHCSFRAASRGGDPDRHWAENRGLDFVRHHDESATLHER